MTEEPTSGTVVGDTGVRGLDERASEPAWEHEEYHGRPVSWVAVTIIIIGFVIGVLPGAGGAIASFFSYITEKKLSKNPEEFGHGAIEGVAGPESANNSDTAGAMIPLLTLIAFYAPSGHRATWFALMASLMNLALVAGQLQTKYLNQLYPVLRGDYGELGGLLIAATVISFVLPIGVILLLGRRV